MTHPSNEKLKASYRCYDIIRTCEAFSYVAYKCPAGVWTIGWGHTGDVNPNDKCTIEQATAWLRCDVEAAERTVKNAVNVPLSQRQYDALVSFVFNVGPGKKGVKSGFVHLKQDGNPSTLLRLVNEEKYADAALEFDKWNKGGGIVLGGLTKRRKMEKELFLEA